MAQICFGIKKSTVGVRCVYPEELASFSLVLGGNVDKHGKYIHTYPHMYKSGKSGVWKFLIFRTVLQPLNNDSFKYSTGNTDSKYI